MRALRQRRDGDEVEEKVQSKDNENEAKEATGCRATCRRRTAQLGARMVQCAAPALRWLSGTRAVAVASHWCTQIYRLYCVAERRLIELRARHPQYARWAMDVPAGVLSAAFFYGDVCSDALIASELHGARQVAGVGTGDRRLAGCVALGQQQRVHLGQHLGEVTEQVRRPLGPGLLLRGRGPNPQVVHRAAV